MWVTRLDRKRAFVNRAYVDFLGISYEEAVDFDWRTIIHPDDAPRIYAEHVAKEAALQPFTLEARYRDTHGAWRWIRSESQPRWDADGNHSGFIGVAYDVTTAKQAAIELEALNATLEARVEARTRERDRAWKHSQDLQVVVNPHGTFLAANEAWTIVLGWAPDEVVGRNHLDFVHPSFHAAAAGVLDNALAAELPAFESLMRHKDGGTRWISWVAAPADGLVYASGRNITAEKNAAAALEAAQEQLRQSQKMEAVGQLTGGIAHDFNNLLTGITGSLEILHNRLLQGRANEAERYIQSAQGAARRAGALTHRLLAFSRRQTLDPKITDVNRLAAGMEELIRRTVGPAILTEFVGASGLWTTLADRNQLENALLNLCINARDAMPDGGKLTIETANIWLDATAASERDVAPGGYVALSVADTGMGMAPDIVNRAFDPFFTTKPIGQGTGLGLSMIYGFARQSGGAVRIDSVPGHGTTMTVILPRHEGAGSTADEAGSLARATSGQNVLVVDTDAVARMLVVEVLRELRYASLEAESATAALEIINADTQLDLLIIDAGVGGGNDGDHLAGIARQKRPKLRVLMITADSKDGEHHDPDMTILLKPFTMDSLTDRIRALLER
jgi:PAS domain S-box-containing protein